jgi:two-component sensor histidine kinase
LSLFTPNTKPLNSFFAKAKYVMAWRICLTFCFVFALLASLFITTSFTILIVFSILFGISLGSLFYLKVTKLYNPIFWIFAISGTIILHYSINTIPNFTHFVDFLWMMAVILMAFIGLGKKIGLAFIIVHTLAIIYFFVFNLNEHIELLQPRTQIQIFSDLIEICLSLFCITYLLHQYITFNNYFGGELKKINIELSKKNEEKIVLVKEIHHRVKNNLQIVISLLRLQKGEMKSDEAKRHFNEAINRIMVMSLIHKKLYQEAEMAHIEVKPYIKDLSNDVIHISNLGLPIKFDVISDINKIGLKTIVPLGLLINELLSNTIKHAFSNNKEGTININLVKKTEKDFNLIYSDNGTWIEPSKGYSGFGLGLIQTLTEQLEGSFTRNQSEYTFTIKNLDT